MRRMKVKIGYVVVILGILPSYFILSLVPGSCQCPRPALTVSGVSQDALDALPNADDSLVICKLATGCYVVSRAC